MKLFIQSISIFFIILPGFSFLGICVCISNKNLSENKEKLRVIVSSDIGGTDPDDFQSMIHFLMYSDRFQVEGLIASPYGKGRKQDILNIIDLYEKDLPELKKHADFPSPEHLRSVTKQGATDANPACGWGEPTEGSEWIIKRARAEKNQPLWILVWGGLDDLAQALHDAPDIVPDIRVYWIGGPNKKWSVNPYCYIASNFPQLWMIENNSTYRGWIIDDEADPEYKADTFFIRNIKNRGALGTDFINYYGGLIKMGDSPSVTYLLNGNPEDPQGESWGGSFARLGYSAFRYFERNTTLADSVPVYSVVTWTFNSAEKDDIKIDHEIWMEIDKQRIDGYYEGNGIYRIRFVPKRIGEWRYVVNCQAKDLNGQTGEFVSKNPWPGAKHPDNITLNNWWSDRTDPDLYLDQYQGAITVAKWREDFLTDWGKCFERISD